MTIELKVPTMSCQHCVNAITNEVSDLPGVERVAIDLGNEKGQCRGRRQCDHRCCHRRDQRGGLRRGKCTELVEARCLDCGFWGVVDAAPKMLGAASGRWIDTMATKQLNLPVTGMTCASCVNRIERGLRKVEGVETAQVNLATEQASINFDPAKVDRTRSRRSYRKKWLWCYHRSC